MVCVVKASSRVLLLFVACGALHAQDTDRSPEGAGQGGAKLLVDGTHTYVFNLRTDLSERNDLARWRQDIAQQLRPLITQWEALVDADAAALRPAGESNGR